MRALRRLSALGGIAALGLALAPLVYGQSATHVTPSLSITERYDTNVFFVQSGKNLEDFVTTLAPRLRVEHDSRLIQASGQVTLVGEIYAINPGLNYIATNASFNANLDKISAMLDKRFTLTVNDSIRYTPQPPAFFTPTPAAQASGLTGPENFIRGIQAVRANSLINIAAVTGAFQFTPTTSVVSSISNQYMRFGTAFAPTPGQGFFTTSFTNVSAGPQFRVTPTDVVSANFNYSNIQFSQGDRFSSSFELQGGTAEWRHEFSKKLVADVTGGVTMFSGNRDLQYVASGLIEYKERHTDYRLSYSRRVFPSFFISAVPLLSQVISAGVVHRFTDRLSVSGSLNYAKNESIPAGVLEFLSYGGTVSVFYSINRNTSLVASYLHNEFSTDFRDNSFSFTRDAISVTLRIEWPDAFKGTMAAFPDSY
ncbi:hypothetical protein [Candidatus Nitrospira bockiana]